TFHQIVDGISALITVTTADGEVELVNRQVLDYFGKSLDELKRWATTDAVHPDDLPRVIAAWERSVELGQTYELEHRIRRADGAYRWFQVRGLPVRDADGRILRWFVLHSDIDDRKRAGALLAETQHLNRTGSFLWRASTDEITWSKEMYRIYEFDESEPLTPERANARVHPEDLAIYLEQVARARREPNEVEFDVRLQFPNGSIKHVHIVSHGSRDESGNVEYTGVVQDVTDRRRAEDALAKLQCELAHVARVSTLGTLTASIAHEVNQPLVGIITNASTCLRMLADDPPNLEGARETARRTIRDGRRASEIIARLRALFAKREAKSELVDLNEATREVIALSLTELRRNRVILRLELSDDLPLVMGDRIQLQQVLLNLLLNASQAMRGVDDRPRELLIVSERDEGDRVRLSVHDVGVGFEPQDADRLFEAFYTTKNGGIGVGLSVRRTIIENHIGRAPLLNPVT